MTNYTNCISIETALYFDLFDDISYKWLKLILDPSVDREENDFEVEIEDLPCDRQAWCIVKFTFELKMVDDIRLGETHYKTKTFSKTIEYNGSSALAMTLCGMVAEDDTEDEEEEEDEEQEEEDLNNACVNCHLGGAYGCDLCCDKEDKNNPEMLKEWLDKNNKYSYKLHRKWLDNKKKEEEEEENN